VLHPASKLFSQLLLVDCNKEHMGQVRC